MTVFWAATFAASTLLIVPAYVIAQTSDNEQNDVNPPRHGIDSVWRSSDFEGEVPTLRQQRKPKRIDGSAVLPEGSERVGCICMDYFVQEHIGRGACSGHNGVRFWLYLLPSGDTVQIPTLRHGAHPDTLSDIAILQLAAYKRFERQMAQRQLDFYKTLEEYPEWLNPTQRVQPDAYEVDSTLYKMLYPIATQIPQNDTPTDVLIYSLSVLIGSGALALLKKIFEKTEKPEKSEQQQIPPPDEPEKMI